MSLYYSFDNMFRTNCVHHQVNKISIKNVSQLQCYIENYITTLCYFIFIGKNFYLDFMFDKILYFNGEYYVLNIHW
jgi:hypothetical protein